jgi:hypothetical protein
MKRSNSMFILSAAFYAVRIVVSSFLGAGLEFSKREHVSPKIGFLDSFGSSIGTNPPLPAAADTSSCNGKYQHHSGYLSASTNSLALLPVAIGWGHTSFEYPLHSIVEPGFVRYGRFLHFDFGRQRQRRFSNCSNSINK